MMIHQMFLIGEVWTLGQFSTFLLWSHAVLTDAELALLKFVVLPENEWRCMLFANLYASFSVDGTFPCASCHQSLMNPYTVKDAGFWTEHRQQARWSILSLVQRIQHPKVFKNNYKFKFVWPQNSISLCLNPCLMGFSPKKTVGFLYYVHDRALTCIFGWRCKLWPFSGRAPEPTYWFSWQNRVCF